MKGDFVKPIFALVAVAAILAIPAAVLAQEQTGTAQPAQTAKVKKGGGARPAPIQGTVREATSRPQLTLDPRGTPKR
jgi:uncharacterized protein YdeI (BOF family)